jgi:ubiquinone/menaquinone biosynthesis C-methylase UbiE
VIVKSNLLQREVAYEQEARLNEQIEAYWDERSGDFSRLRLKELSGPCGAAWSKMLAEKLPAGALRVLDVGTGAGFLAILLAKLGHKVTGVDMSGEMLHQAKQNALAAGCSVEFRKENAQALSFAGESFDAVVTRNLTWTLPDVMEAYREWQRVLKPGGLLLNFDSDYGMVSFGQKDDPIDVHAGIRKELVTECNDIKDELRISTHRRPGWDVEFLTSLGMAVSLEADIGDRVHVDESMQFDQVPLFCIRACK